MEIHGSYESAENFSADGIYTSTQTWFTDTECKEKITQSSIDSMINSGLSLEDYEISTYLDGMKSATPFTFRPVAADALGEIEIEYDKENPAVYFYRVVDNELFLSEDSVEFYPYGKR